MRLPALLAGTLLAQPALGQTSTEPFPGGWTPDAIVVTGERPDYTANEASVTRTPVPLIDVPQSIQVLTRKLIEDQEVQTLDEALRNVSGVVPSLPSEVLLVNPLVRGFEAEIFTDGLIGYGDTAVIDAGSLWNMERVEVAKGPTATLFGGGTGAPVGGLINLVSKTAGPDTRFAFRLRGGSFDELGAAVDANLALSDALAVRLVAEQQQAGDFIDQVEIDRTLLSPSIRIAPADGTELIGRFTYTRIAQLEYTGLPAQFQDDLRVERDRFSGATNAPDTVVENLTAQVELNQRLTDDITLSLRGRRYENEFREFATSPFLAFFPCGEASGLSDTTCPQLRVQLPAKVDEWTADGSITAEFATGGVEHVLLAGVQWDEAGYNAALGFGFADIVPFDYADPQSDIDYFPVPALGQFFANEYRTLAAYLQNQITVGDRLHMLGSIRYSRLRLEELTGGGGFAETYHEWDPRVGVSLEVADGFNLFAGYATGSRLALFFARDAAPVPERSESWETGAKFALANLGLTGTLAAFRIERTNVPTPDPAAFGRSIQTGEQVSEGIEADFIFEPNPAFSLLASYAYTDARVREDTVIPAGDRLPRVAEHRGRIAARYRFANGLELGAGVTGASDSVITLPNGAEVDGFIVADAQASYSLGGVRIGVRVYNLLNEDYLVPYQYFAQDVVRPGNPRSAFVTVGFEL